VRAKDSGPSSLQTSSSCSASPIATADGSAPETFLAYIKVEMQKYEKLVREAKIRAQP
jgi:hypothetical protein